MVLCIVLITSKFYNDVYYQNKYIADEGCVPLEELNLLERHFLDIIEWNLMVSGNQSKAIDLILNDVFNIATGKSPISSSPISTP